MSQLETTGLFQWAKWGLTTAAAATVGIVSGGNLTIDPDRRTRTGIGGRGTRRGGIIKPTCRLDYYVASDNADLFGYSFRASYPRGALQALRIDGGADEWGRRYDPAYVNEFSLDWAMGEALKASQTVGTVGSASYAEIAGDDMDAAAEDVSEDYEFVLQVDTDEYGAQSLGLRGSNNNSYGSSGDTKVASNLRFPTWRRQGLEVVTLDLVLGRPLPTAVHGAHYDCPPDDIEITLTGANCAGDTILLDLTDLMISGPEDFGLVDNNAAAEWRYSFDTPVGGGGVSWTFTPATP